MYRRVFSASFAAANTSSPSSSSSTTSSSSTRAFLAPRPDVDISEQKRLVAREKAESKAKLLAREKACSLYGPDLSPVEENRVMEFNRHSLRLLVLEAHNRQVNQSRTSHCFDPSASAAEECVGDSCSSESSPTAPRRGAVTPPPEGHFDLTQRSNVAHLLQDIDTLMAVAQQKPPQTRDRILNQTYEQVARLSLWNDLS